MTNGKNVARAAVEQIETEPLSAFPYAPRVHPFPAHTCTHRAPRRYTCRHGAYTSRRYRKFAHCKHPRAGVFLQVNTLHTSSGQSAAADRASFNGPSVIPWHPADQLGAAMTGRRATACSESLRHASNLN